MDHVDHLLARWARERPELDIRGLRISARVIRLQRFLDRRTEQLTALSTVLDDDALASLEGGLRRVRAELERGEEA